MWDRLLYSFTLVVLLVWKFALSKEDFLSYFLTRSNLWESPRQSRGFTSINYESSLDKPAAKLKSRGTSKSAASRHLVSQTTKKLEEYLSRRLEEFELAALMLDGLEVAGQTVVVTLGITQ